jgi:hypothetical protein
LNGVGGWAIRLDEKIEGRISEDKALIGALRAIKTGAKVFQIFNR